MHVNNLSNYLGENNLLGPNIGTLASKETLSFIRRQLTPSKYY